MNTPLISIVLPVYNGERNLADSIVSCLEQTYRNFEIIIVNDCSTDRTLQIAAEFALKDDRIKIVSNSTNRKLPASLNVGFEQSRGNFLTWTSDDNRYKSNALAEMLNQIMQNNADLVYADYDVVNVSGAVVERKKLKEPEHLFSYNHVGACFLYKRSVFERLGGYRTDLFCAEDYEYWLRIWTAGMKMHHIPQSLYFYADNPCSLTATRRDLILAKTIQLKMEYVDKVPVSAKAKVKALFRLYRKKSSRELKRLMIDIAPFYAYYLLVRYRLIGK